MKTAIAVVALAGITAGAQAPGGTPMSSRAKGTFEVKVTPIEPDKESVAAGRLTIVKTFAGDLVGTGKATMWTADGAEGSGGYVAIEKVEATLAGRSGSFTLLHQGTMTKGADFRFSIVVVPDSATGGLTGLTGTMSIEITGGKHFYELAYSLP
jgi:hypothetical protein